MCRQNGDIITFKTNVSDTYSATQHKDSLQLAMQLKVLLQTKRPHIKPNCNRLVSFTPLKAWRRNLSKRTGAGKELDFHSQNRGIASCKVYESPSINSDMNSK